MSGPAQSASEIAREVVYQIDGVSYAGMDRVQIETARRFVTAALTAHAAEARRVALEEAATRVERVRDREGSMCHKDPLRYAAAAIRALAAPARESEEDRDG